MATSSTYKARQRIEAIQRISVGDLEDISELGLDNQEEDNFCLVSTGNYVIEGMQIVHVSGREFACNDGKVIINGDVLKLTGGPLSLGDQDACTSGNKRFDIVYVDDTNRYIDGQNDSATKTVMSAVTMTTVTGEAVGTGDGSTATWDLANEKVDPATLIVKVDGSQEVEGWVFSKGTGSGSVDQIIFDVAPAGSTAITADYDYLSGGVESSTSVYTRYERYPNAVVWKGTESASPSYATELAAFRAAHANALILASIEYPLSWSTGAPTAIDNTEKSFLLSPDNLAEESGVTHTPNKTATGHWAGKIMHPLRNIHGLSYGFRLRWSSATEIKVGAGFAIVRGVAMAADADTTFSPVWGVDISAAGWHFVYLKCQPTNTTAPGSAPDTTIFVDTTAPDTMLREPTEEGTFYVGAIYNTSGASVAIREFYHHGDFYMWAAPSALTPSASTDEDLVAWCPETGTLVDLKAKIVFTPGATGDDATVVVKSHKVSGSIYSGNSPSMQADMYCEQAGTPTGTRTVQLRGLIRAEQDGSARYVHYTFAANSGSPTASVQFVVNGFIDDYRHMATSGNYLSH